MNLIWMNCSLPLLVRHQARMTQGSTFGVESTWRAAEHCLSHPSHHETSGSCSSTMASSRTLGRIQHVWGKPSPDWINLATVGPIYQALYHHLQEGLTSQIPFYFYMNLHHRPQYNFKTLSRTQLFGSSSVTVSAKLCSGGKNRWQKVLKDKNACELCVCVLSYGDRISQVIEFWDQCTFMWFCGTNGKTKHSVAVLQH